MKQIPLGNIKRKIIDYALVDDDVFDYINSYSWHKSHGYAVSTVNRNLKLKMHRTIFEYKNGKIPNDKCIDHINRNRLDNRLENLRLVSPLENALNKSIGKNNTTGYFGVRLDKRNNKGRYQCYSTYIDTWFSIGYFDNIKDAAIAHDIYMKNTYPNEFLNLNFPNATQEEISSVRNIMNNPKKRKGKSKYKGVILFANRNKCWCARFRKKTLGYFLTEEEAAKKYNEAAYQELGDKANLNKF